MKKRYFIIIGLVAVLLFSAHALSAEFWASKNSNKYHVTTCRYAQKIKSSSLIKFGSPEEAVAAGYIPCKSCKPPLANESRLR
ncbi:Ada metal-binding domain-containing protein [Thermodesulfobacteriota bacterium]